MPGRSKSERVTLKDVAKRANVSVQLASQVLANTPGVRVAAATRERIESAAIQVGYVPDRIAQAMKTGKTGIVSLWMPVDRPVATFLRVLNAVSREARLTRHELMIVGLTSEVAYGTDTNLPHPWPSDGVLAFDAGRAIRSLMKNNDSHLLPTVIMGAEQFERVDTVTWDVIGSARRLTEHLISSGARNIAYVSPRWVMDAHPDEQRGRGYREAMESAGLETRVIVAESESADSAAEAVEKDCASDPPEAITSFSDSLALGAIRGLTSIKVQVPSDCEVWGYGDHPESSESSVPLSTLRVPVDEMVPLAWQWLISRMLDPRLESRYQSIPLEIVMRESSRTCPQ